MDIYSSPDRCSPKHAREIAGIDLFRFLSFRLHGLNIDPGYDEAIHYVGADAVNAVKRQGRAEAVERWLAGETVGAVAPLLRSFDGWRVAMRSETEMVLLPR